MYNPVLLEMLVHEQQRQIEAEVSQRQLLKAISREPPSIFRWLISKIFATSGKKLDKKLQAIH
jgi:hypothetical protein